MNSFNSFTKWAAMLSAALGASLLAGVPALAQNSSGSSQMESSPSAQTQNGQFQNGQSQDGQLQNGQLQNGNQTPSTPTGDAQSPYPTQTDNTQTPGSTTQMEDSQSNPSANQSMNLVDVASSNDSFNTLTQAVQAAGLTDTLANQGPYTIFAPTDEAFSQLPEGAIDYLMQPENQDLLRQVLLYHVVPGEVASNNITTGKVDSLGGGLAVRTADDRVIVNNASVINPDIPASNGTIHAVNRVLLPENLQQALAARLGVQDIY